MKVSNGDCAKVQLPVPLPGRRSPSPIGFRGVCCVKKLIEAYDEYIKLLAESEKGLIGLAYAHGYRCPPELVNRGEELRAKIAKLKLSVLTE
jgi:hypothetical protein